MQITTIGLDIAKNVFQVHGIDAAEKVVVRKQLRRSQLLAFFKALPPCLVGMEACATAHYWARELTKLGHTVRLMPAKDVKAYVKRNKNDAADAEAICEAVRRPTMRFVQIKSPEQQGRLMQHRARDLLIRQRTQVINGLRAHLAELGITAAQGNAGLKELLAIIASDEDARLPADAHAVLIVLAAELQAMQTLITSIEKRIMAQHRSSEESKRLETIPGIGVVGATAITATVTDPNIFRSGRDFSAWIGLVPRQDSTGGKQKLGPISKQGDRYLLPGHISEHLRSGDKALVGNSAYRRYLKTPDDKHFEIDDKRVAEDARYDSLYVLRTNMRLDALDLMLRYRELLGSSDVMTTRSARQMASPTSWVIMNTVRPL